MAGRRGGPTFDDLLATIGANLQRHRIAKRITQGELAETLDITVEHLRGVEGGYRTASLRLLFDAARELSVEFGDLLSPAARVARNPGRPPKRTDPA
jgi:transcriptional regulator with XRE-family HTH domain